jgi:hypothetical protein
MQLSSHSTFTKTWHQEFLLDFCSALSFAYAAGWQRNSADARTETDILFTGVYKALSSGDSNG